ncbi:MULTISPECIES: hypothetical protein [Mesoflavibacter]|uniref:hypothetical protein n=1 Tax=Mesoflavibacter TaxID=444051 RepID=UPI000D11452C|nr:MULTISPECIES: hypothetical protein [Mesoflavibacter]QIJ88815.1 hypothetical protein C7H62_1006 [Mesoflavibacter sp. HG96]QIJ91543.1 hypothetical protein C7H56_1006 [Mesoflavibacter sp. HG37]
MKKVLILLLSLVALSCSLDDENNVIENYHVEILPIESAIVPESFNYGEEHEITVTYLRPNSCHAFNDFYYVKDNNERTVAIMSTVLDNNQNCLELNDEQQRTFTLEATQTENYVFKFWQGEDDSGNDTYLIIEVPVNQ